MPLFVDPKSEVICYIQKRLQAIEIHKSALKIHKIMLPCEKTNTLIDIICLLNGLNEWKKIN